MGHTPTSTVHPVHHSLARAAGIDIAAVAFAFAAAMFSFFLGAGSANWVNALVSVVVFVLALCAVVIAGSELRFLWRKGPDDTHPGGSVAAVVVALVVLCITVPMLLFMPFVFLGAIA